ncbi:aminopeptidase N [Ruegeria faecimaris]|uniref:aminopeptidase N n=1 Tax=Ruegeria faecimaris TaxID=686389 RepID=UPI00249387DD|nr:aminopeptidase N [Ruegeria faecimaris]
MRDAAPTTIYLKDYTPFGYLVDSVHLTFDLAPNATRVTSRIAFRPNPDALDRQFFLHGEQLKLIRATVDGVEINPDVTETGLTAVVPDAAFVWEAEVEIDPGNNTALEGLYMSNGMYCTQCEAEGFRKITFYPDRPDVMSIFTVRINGALPVLLSNGNPTGKGDGWAEWNDPWPKPAYLFALVAGDLITHPGQFTTKSGREVELNLWVRPGDEGKCAFGMEALKKSMKWDEDVYGREYDLDVFNIVAVDDFNMGAMENKGLNIFNSSAVLASPETSTDMNFERIEAIIAHEYFHNWTGNRITCRDWFQLCLKEGLTVYRDAQFTSDMRSAPVKRIHDAIDLRARQFAEDNGPLSHPVRPESFQEINNFYTATVYEKGAEVIGMLKRLVGDEAYAQALELYFDRHDGQACTIEDWIKVFEDTTGRDLTQFKRWYSQSGTPRVSVTEEWTDGIYTLTLRQRTDPTPGQSEKLPQVIPVAVGLIGANGDETMPTTILEFTQETQSFAFVYTVEGWRLQGCEGPERVSGANPPKPTASILRDFSAPVILEHDQSSAERAFLLAHDSDPFNRWQAGRSLAEDTLIKMILTDAAPETDYLDGILAVLRDSDLDPSYRALMLGLPSQSELAAMMHEQGVTPDPVAIWTAVETLRQVTAQHVQDLLPRLHSETSIEAAFSPDAEQAGQRALGGAALALTSRLDGGAKAAEDYQRADNMTLQLSALSCLLRAGKGEQELNAFYDRWQDDRLVMDKWFGLQVAMSAPAETADIVSHLTGHPDFNWKNPNRFRAVLGALATNHAGFHRADGAGYSLLADWLIKLDPVNPQTTARMCSAFQTWKRYDADRQALIRNQLTRIAETPDLSRDTTEMVTRILNA